MKPLVAVFAKAPEPGAVKTRLVPPLSPQQAAQLHRRLVTDVWLRLQSLIPAADIELHTSHPTTSWPEATPHIPQCHGDLGQRMLHTLNNALDAGRPRAVIIGGDIPELPIEAIRALLASPADVSLGPTRDGGFYAISCCRTHPDMFAGVRWSTPHTLSDTISACARQGLSISIGQPWHDVDTAEDLDLLPPHLRP